MIFGKAPIFLFKSATLNNSNGFRKLWKYVITLLTTWLRPVKTNYGFQSCFIHKSSFKHDNFEDSYPKFLGFYTRTPPVRYGICSMLLDHISSALSHWTLKSFSKLILQSKTPQMQLCSFLSQDPQSEFIPSSQDWDHYVCRCQCPWFFSICCFFLLSNTWTRQTWLDCIENIKSIPYGTWTSNA